MVGDRRRRPERIGYARAIASVSQAESRPQPCRSGWPANCWSGSLRPRWPPRLFESFSREAPFHPIPRAKAMWKHATKTAAKRERGSAKEIRRAGSVAASRSMASMRVSNICPAATRTAPEAIAASWLKTDRRPDRQGCRRLKWRSNSRRRPARRLQCFGIAGNCGSDGYRPAGVDRQRVLQNLCCGEVGRSAAVADVRVAVVAGCSVDRRGGAANDADRLRAAENQQPAPLPPEPSR